MAIYTRNQRKCQIGLKIYTGVGGTARQVLRLYRRGRRSQKFYDGGNPVAPLHWGLNLASAMTARIPTGIS